MTVPAAAAAVIAVVALIGAAASADALQGFSGSWQPMLPSTAIVTVLAAAGLWRAITPGDGPHARALGAVVVLASAITFAECLAGERWWIDAWLGKSAAPGRSGADAAVCSFLIGAALLTLDRGRAAQAAALAAAAVSLMGLLEHLFGVRGLDEPGGGSALVPMGLPAALATLLLSTAVVLARPQSGVLALARSDGPGGGLLRRLAPLAVVVPIALGFLSLEGHRAGWYGTEEGLALFCGSLIVVLCILIALTAHTLDRVEAARRAGHRREHAIMEATADAVIPIDADARVLGFNRAAEQMFGRSRADVGGLDLQQLIAPAPGEAGGGPRQWVARWLERGGAAELVGRHADGREFPIDLTITRLEGDDQSAFVAHVRDATERVEGERAARRLAALVESSGDAIISATFGGIVTSWNGGAERIYGHTREQAIGGHLMDLIIPPSRRAEAPAGVSQLLGGTPVTGEAMHVRRDGSTFLAEATASAIRGADGSISDISLIVRDATRRREREQVVRRLATIVESTPEAVYAFDADGTVTVWNAAAERIFGYTAEEAIGGPVTRMSEAADPARRVSSVFQDLRRGETVSQDGTARRKDGTRVELAYTAFPIHDAAGEVVTVGVIAGDVTERRKLEEQLRQAQKLEAVGQLAGGIAHDFNNLLTVITGFGALARAEIGDGPGAEELDHIESAARRATALTGQLLAFSRRQQLDPVALDLGEVVRGVLPLVRRLIGEDIEIETRLAGELPIVLADAGQIEQVLVNLAVNARDAMPSGGTLTIETRAQRLDVPDKPSLHACLSVTDTGTGIDREALPHIFEPFYTTKGVGEGTGLGLATVHGVVTQSGGQLRVYSEVGHGTIVKVFLPAGTGVEPVAAADRPAHGSALVGGDETILVCEDEESVRHLLERLLAGAGYNVLAAGRPQEALALAEAGGRGIGGLVSDVIMPEMPGPELARRLQEVRPGLPTLFLSGYTADTVHGRGSLPLGSAFLEKPFEGGELLRTLRELLDRVQ